jgi:hypothetical protein
MERERGLMLHGIWIPMRVFEHCANVTEQRLANNTYPHDYTASNLANYARQIHPQKAQAPDA